MTKDSMKIERSKLKIIFFGTPNFVIPVLNSIADNFQLVGVVTTPDAIQGRKKLLTPSPVKQFTQEKLPKIPILNPQQFNNITIQQLKNLIPDLFVVAAYGKIIPQTILDLPKNGALNIHPSLLPKYRGPSPIQTAILYGDEITGVSIIKMDDEMDHGPILSQWEKPITSTDTYATLHHILFNNAAEKLPHIISEYINGELTLKEQNEAEATYCQKIKKEDGYFTPHNPPSPEILDRMIRAYYPWPTAWTRLHQDYGGQALKGKIVKFYPEGKIQMEGKNIVTMKEFNNGYPELKEFISGLFYK